MWSRKIDKEYYEQLIKLDNLDKEVLDNSDDYEECVQIDDTFDDDSECEPLPDWNLHEFNIHFITKGQPLASDIQAHIDEYIDLDYLYERPPQESSESSQQLVSDFAALSIKSKVSKEDFYVDLAIDEFEEFVLQKIKDIKENKLQQFKFSGKCDKEKRKRIYELSDENDLEHETNGTRYKCILIFQKHPLIHSDTPASTQILKAASLTPTPRHQHVEEVVKTKTTTNQAKRVKSTPVKSNYKLRNNDTT